MNGRGLHAQGRGWLAAGVPCSRAGWRPRTHPESTATSSTRTLTRHKGCQALFPAQHNVVHTNGTQLQSKPFEASTHPGPMPYTCHCGYLINPHQHSWSYSLLQCTVRNIMASSTFGAKFLIIYKPFFIVGRKEKVYTTHIPGRKTALQILLLDSKAQSHVCISNMYICK